MRTALLAFFPLVFACRETVESEDVRTSGIYPEMIVTATGSGRTDVQVRLKVGGNDSNTFLVLTGADKLEATVGATTRTLDETSDETYTASFGVDAEDTQVVISLVRGEADEGAPASVVSLPAPFAASLGAAEYSRAADAVAMSWEPGASGLLDWRMSGSCIHALGDSVPDDGTHSLPAGSIDTFDSERNETCTVGVEFTRSRRGNIDSAFTEGGSIVARQVRSDGFTSTP
jgi:hypothetical protein